MNGPNLEGHIKQCTSPGNVGISGFMAPHVKPQPAIPLEVVCQGFHDCLVTFEGEQYDMTVLHTCPPSEQRNWYPIAEQRFAFAKQGEVITRTGTLKHRECKQVAVGPDNRPTGTYTCAACATLDPRRSREIRDLIRRREDLGSKVAAASEAGAVLDGVNNRHLGRDALTAKLDVRKGQVNELAHTKRAAILSRDKRFAALHKALANDDISTVVHWMNVMLMSDEAEQTKVARSLICGIAESTGRKVSDPTGKKSKGMRWRADVKDVSATLLLTAGPKVTRLLQANLNLPALRTAVRARDDLREPYVVTSENEGYNIENFQRVARVWKAIRQRLEASGELKATDVLPYEIKIDETPIEVSNGPTLYRNRDSRGKPTGPDFVVGCCGKKFNCMVSGHPWPCSCSSASFSPFRRYHVDDPSRICCASCDRRLTWPCLRPHCALSSV